MKAIWQGFVRTIFWSYERGSWPYDVAVVVIVIFVLATPDTSANTATYRVDATVLAAEKRANHPTPELEREMHRILASSVGELKDQPFEVTRIDPQTAANGSVAAYDVAVRR
jgi:hypothetical protein